MSTLDSVAIIGQTTSEELIGGLVIIFSFRSADNVRLGQRNPPVRLVQDFLGPIPFITHFRVSAHHLLLICMALFLLGAGRLTLRLLFCTVCFFPRSDFPFFVNSARPHPKISPSRDGRGSLLLPRSSFESPGRLS